MRCSVFAFLILAACGGSSGTAVIDPIDELPKTIDPEPDPTPTGTASYRGPTTLAFVPALSEAVDLNGTLSLNVDFDSAAEAVTGSASGFETGAGGAVEGRLFLSGGALDDRDVALLFDSQISGSLRSGTDSYLIFGQMAGEFVESGQSAVTGRITGTARQSGADATLSGTFQAGRLP
jgi:hypothetical protein